MFDINLPQKLKEIVSSRGNRNKTSDEIPLGPAQPTWAPFVQADIATSNYGVASVIMANSQDEEKVSSPEQVERILKNFLNNDEYKISTYSELFANLDKLDYENIERHLRHIKIFLGMNSNSPGKIVQKGYFYSKEGAMAFDSLAGILSDKSDSGFVSPLSIALNNYDPKTVLILEKRGLLNPKGIDNYHRLSKLANMNDEEYKAYKKRVDESIRKTGTSFQVLASKVKQQTKPLMNDYVYKFFEKNCINRESVVAQLELLDIMKDFPIEYKNYGLEAILSSVDVDNIDSYKKVLKVAEKRSDIEPLHLNSILGSTNKKNENIVCDLLKREDIPISKISEYCSKDDNFAKGIVPYETIMERINNDPYVMTMRAIENSTVNLIPQNTNITALNPHKIEPSALALVHMTDYETENGVILSTRDKLQGSRNSVHFTLNHAVAAHRSGDWDGKKYAIIMPYDSTVKNNAEGKFIEGMPNDLYTNGSVKIPEGSIILKYNPELQNGETKIKNSPDIDGVKLIETSIYPHQMVPVVLKKMGYSHMQANGPIGLFSYGKNNGKNLEAALENYTAWKTFGDNHGIKPTRHTGSAADIAEKVVENIGKLCVNNSWYGGRDNLKDYKKQQINYLETIKSWQDMGYFVSYDLDAMIKLIEESATPKDAVSAMKEKFGFHPTLEYEYFNQCTFDIPMDLYSTWHDMSDDLSKLGEYFEEWELD